MKSNSCFYKRKSIRLKGYDYSNPGAYFITICVKEKQHMFGEVVNGKVHLNGPGEIVKREWLKTFAIRKNLGLDEYVIMPNHFHGIMIIKCRGTVRRAPTGVHYADTTLQRAPTAEQFGKPVSCSLPTVVRLFKSAVTKHINEIRSFPKSVVWQRNYYEHVIRNEFELNSIKEYIQNNPMKWHLDRENPDRIGCDGLENNLFEPRSQPPFRL
jgi:REP element-mobilizing transposase RayT